MSWLIVGLVVFLGAHSVRIFAEEWRTRQIERLGVQRWKAIYSLVSVAGFALIVWGYALARQSPLEVWSPPPWTRHIAALLTVLTFVLWAAAYVPGNRIKAAVGHPMVAAVKTWAFAHLLANGTLAAVILFGAFLLWAVVDFASLRRRDRATGTRYPAGPGSRDAIVLVVGLAAWALFAYFLHDWLIGVRPFG